MAPSLWLRSLTGDQWRQLWPVMDPGSPVMVEEGGQYLLDLRDVADPLSADLLLDDVPLEALRPPDRTTARWRWTPGFYAGSSEARLELGRAGRHRFELVTDPARSKLTREQFTRMVSDILELTQALFAISAFRTGIGRSSTSRPPPLARLEFLRTRFTELQAVVQAITRQPQRALQATEEARPYHRARGVTGPEIERSFRTGRVLQAQATGQLPAALRGHLPARIVQRQRHVTFDTREHRQIKASLRGWAAWLTSVADLLDAHRQDQDAGPVYRAWASRTRRLAAQLQSLHQQPLFQEVADRAEPVTLTSVYRNVPAYARFLRLHREISLGLADISGDFLNLPLSETFRLYELWCYLQLLRAAERRGLVDPQALRPLFAATPGRGEVTLRTGAVGIPLSSGETLSFQRTYREYWMAEPLLNGTRRQQGTYSREMRPDVALEGPRHTVILDAKYRVGRNLNEALASVHMYRDAIVEAELDSGEVRRSVRAAYLLSPQGLAPSGDWKRTGLPGRLFHPMYRSEFRFGAFQMIPGMTPGEIDGVLDHLLQDASAS